MLVWPTAEQVDGAARAWARRLSENNSTIRAIGYFGSYARGDWGVGSDLDLVAVIHEGAGAPRDGGGIDWDLESLPVPAELRIYSAHEWAELLLSNRRTGQVLRDETVWLTPPHSP
ncbi:MAG: nucleotidyltransferase domain-containing protein [Trueperaceae bacterium]